MDIRSDTDDNKTGQYVQYGCGLEAPDNWVNFDASPRLFLERLLGVSQVARLFGTPLFPPNVKFGNIVKGIPLEDESVKAVYASHVLEHLARNDVSLALNNTFRLLYSGGVFRLIVPDLEWRARRYLQNIKQEEPETAADHFFHACNIGMEDSPHGLVAYLRSAFGSQEHRWMYDWPLMSKLLASAGFINIHRCSLGDSQDKMFALVEHENRFYDSGEPELAIEAQKP